MKKIFWVFFVSLVLLSSMATVDAYDQNQGIVPCGNPGQEQCGISDFFAMLANIYDFIVKWIAAPLAILMICLGGVMMMISAGNQNLFGLGKKTLTWSLIGLALVFCSWILIKFILEAMGYKYIGSWNTL